MTDKAPEPLSEGVPPAPEMPPEVADYLRTELESRAPGATVENARVFPEPEQQPTEASTLTGLAQLAGALSQASMTAEAREGLVNDILGRINAAPDDVKAALAANPSVKELVRTVLEQEPAAPKGAQPGSYVYRMLNGEKVISGVVDWTWADLAGMARKTWEPNETILLGWNGLFITVRANEETTLPEVFKGIYDDRKKNLLLAQQHAAFLMKKGPMPSDPTILTPDGMRARSIANHDGAGNLYAPGAGNIPEWTSAVQDAMEEPTPVAAGS